MPLPERGDSARGGRFALSAPSILGPLQAVVLAHPERFDGLLELGFELDVGSEVLGHELIFDELDALHEARLSLGVTQ